MRQFIITNISIFIFMMAFSIGNISAQPPGGGQQRPPQIPSSKQIQKMVNEVSKELSLTDEQKLQVSKLYVTHFDEIKGKLKNGRPEPKEMEVLETKFEKEVNKVLNKDQQKHFADYQKKNRQQLKGRERPNR